MSNLGDLAPNFTCTSSSLLTGCNIDTGSINLYSGKVEFSQYGYNVNKSIAIVFLVFFAVSAILHFGQSLYFRIYWCLYTFFLGAACEAIGWGGRVMSAVTTVWVPYQGGYWDSSRNGFMMQICCTIIAPAFFAAANYVLLGILIRETKTPSTRYSSFKPRGYTIIFVTGDIVSLVVQAIGGGMAASSNTLSAANTGAYVMVGGIVWQMVIMVAYTLVLCEFLYRFTFKVSTTREIDLVGWIPGCGSCCGGRRSRRRQDEKNAAAAAAAISPMEQSDKPTSESSTDIENGKPSSQHRVHAGATGKRPVKVKVLLAACAFSTLLIFVRSVYRTIELLNGWSGRIATDQTLFCVLDALLMAITIWLYNIVHPGLCL